MSKLDEIKAALAQYDEAKAAYMTVVEEFYNPDINAHSMESRILQTRYRNVLETDTAWKALKVLLPIVEASKKFCDETHPREMAVLSTMSAHMWIYHNKRDELLEALKALGVE